MTASMVLDGISEEAGWDTDSQLILALRFIDSQTKLGDWRKFLEDQANEEQDQTRQFLEDFLDNCIENQ